MATSSIRDEIRKRYNITEETKKKPDKVSKSVGNITTTISSDPKKYVDDFFADAEKFNGSTKSLFDSMNYGNRNASYDSYKKQSEGLRNRSNNIRKYFDANRASIGEEEYNSVIAALDDFDRSTSQSQYSFYRKRNALNKYTSDEEYQTDVRRQGYMQKYGNMENSDIYTAMSNMSDGEEKEWLNSLYNYNNLRKYGNMSVTDLQKAVWNLEPGAEKDWVSSYYADKIHNMTSGEIAQARENAVVSEEDQLIIEDLLHSNMPYRRDYAEQDGRDMDLYDEVESNRNYISEKYGIVFTESSYDNSQMLANLLQSASSQGENQIAYTTPEGHNITWSKLEQNAKYNEDLQSKFDTYSQMPDWDEKAYTIESVADTESDYMIVTGLARSLVPYSWETAQANGIDRQTWEDTERKRRYINQKYGVDLHNSGYDDINILNNIAANLDGKEGEKEIFELLPQLDQKELQVLSYIYETQGRAAAYAWHKSRMPLYQDRSNNVLTYNMAYLGEKNPVAGSLASMYFSLGSSVEYLADIFDYAATGETPNNEYSRASSALRAGVMRGTDWNWGNVDVFDFLYGTGMSLADTVMAGKIGKIAGGAAGLTDDALGAFAGKVGGTQLGLSTAAQATNDALDRGMSVGQAVIGGMAAGVFEGLFESWSIGKFEALKPIDSLRGREIAKNIGKSFLVNASEETLTEVANLAYDYIANGDFSQYETLVRKYVYSGMSETEAKKQASLDLGAQVAEAAASGALMGIVSGTKGAGRAAYQSIVGNLIADTTVGKQIKDAGNVDALMQLANDVAGVSSEGLQKQFAKQTKKVGKDKPASRWVGRLYDTLGEAYSEQNKADIVKSLERNDFTTEKATSIADALVARAKGRSLTYEQQELLSSVDNNKDVRDAVTNIVENQKSTMGQRNKTMRDFANDVAIGMVKKRLGIDSKTLAKAAEQEFAPKGEYDASADGKAFLKSDPNKTLDIKGVASIRDGEMMLDIGDDQTVNAKDVSYASESDALIYEAVANMGNRINAETANKLIAKYDGKNALVFAKGIAQAYTYGFYGLDRSEMMGKHSLATELTEAQRNYAYNLGAQYRTNKDQADAAKARALKVDTEKGVYYRSKDGTVTDISAYLKESNTALKDVQKTAIEVMRKMSKTMGVRFNVFESWVENGKRYYLDENGVKTQGNPNGFYDTKTGEIYIDLNAGNGYEGTMLFTIAHELTHFMRQWSPEHFTKIAKIVFKHGNMRGSVSDLVALKIKKAADKGKSLSYDTAMEELVADGMETILKDGKVIEFMAEVKQKDRTAWEQLKGWFKNLEKFLRKLVWAYKGHSAQTEEGARVAAFAEDLLDQIKQIYAEGAVAAGENYLASLTPGEEGVIVNKNGEPVAHATEDGTVQLSMRTYEEEGRSAFRAYLEKCVKNKKLTKEEMQEMLDGIENIYNTCKEFKDKYAPFGTWSEASVVRDTYGKPVFSVVTPNGEYKMNLDFSLVCKKRRTLDAVFNEMSKRGIIDDFELGQKSVVKINEIIRKYGFETACALCFVDAKRFRQASMADSFTRLYNELVESLVPEDQRSSIEHFNFSGYETIKKVEGGIHTWDSSKLDFSHINHVLKTYGDGTVEYKAAKYIKSHAEGRKLLLRGDFMSSKGFDAVKTQNQDILKLYNSKKGTGGPKAAFGDVQYLNEVIQKARWWTPAKAYSVGGVRIQSFSDYVPRMVFDYVQMVYDLAATKLPAHAYTKEALFAKQFGLTGIKINMSLIPAIAKDGIAPGLDAKGNYVWAGESFDYETAKEIQNAEGYTENCGTICVGVSYKHIIKLLSDPNIRMVIPYHKSGLNPIVAHMNKIAEFTDYTTLQTNPGGCQNTIDKNGSKVEKDFNFNAVLKKTGDPKATVQQYLSWCAKNEYTPRFAEFAWHENYYKLIEDFTLYDKDSKYVPQREVRAVFPTESSAFGSMKSLIEEGLQEDAIIEGKRDKNLPAIVDEIQQTLPKTESEIDENEVEQADRDLEADRKFSIREEFYKEFDAWDKKDTNLSFIVGTTSNALLSIGMKNQNIILRSGTVLQKIKDHPEMTFDIFKGIPELLEHPIIVQFSDAINPDTNKPKYDSSITILGELYAEVEKDGKKEKKPVLVSLELLPTNSKGTAVLNFSIIKSAYSKNALQQYINENSILYIDPDKKRTDSWLSLNRLQLPLGENRYGSIRKIAYVDGKVKVQSSKNMTAMQKKMFEAGLIDEFGNKLFSDRDTSYLDAVNRGDMETAQKMVDEAAKAAGYTAKGYHGSRTPGFTVVDKYTWLWLARDESVANEYGTYTEVDNKGKPHNEKGVYAMRYSLGKNLEVYADGASWGELPVTEDDYPGVYADEETGDITTDSMAEWAARNGYDSITFVDVDDGGLTTVDVVFNPNRDAKSADPVTYDDSGNVIPLSQRFNKEKGDIRYQDRDTESVSNRSLLANAFEGVAKPEELPKLQEYKEKIGLINAEERKLSELNEQINELSFAKGPRDTKKIKDLQFEARQTANRISTYDKILLRMEASSPLQAVLQREKKMAYQRAEQKGKEALAAYKERAAKAQKDLIDKWQESRKKGIDSRQKTEMRKKIRKVILDLDKILNRGNKKQNVKEDMKGFVASAIASADALFTENYSDEDMVRNGVGTTVTPEEQKYLDEARTILAEISNLPSGSYEAMLARQEMEGKLKSKLSYRMAKLKDVFLRERIRLNEAEVSSVLGNLADEYANLKNSKYEYVKGAFQEQVYNYIKYLQDDFGGTKIKDMSIDQLKNLYKAYTMVMTTVRNANKAFVMSKSVDQIVEKLVTEFGNRKMPQKKIGAIARNISNMTGWNYEKLYYALDRIGSDTLKELFTNLANSENIVMTDVIEAKQAQASIVEKYKYNTWNVNQKIDKEFVDNTGKVFHLTLGELMSLYAYSRREGAWNHIEYGGFVFGKTALTEVDPAAAYKLTKEQCEAITNTLTDNHKKFVEEMQTFLSDVMGAKGNEVSMLLYGIEMFGEKNYFPIHIAGQFKANAQESRAKEEAGFSSMTNAGFTQAQNKDAKAPFVMESFMDVWSDHVNEMSRYHGTVPALEDIRKVMNYSYYSDSFQDSVAVKAIMENKFGKQAVQYFNDLYQEANSGAITDKMQKASHKLLSKFRKNSVAYSLSVLIQQPAAMVRAYALVRKKYFRGIRGVGALPIGIAQAATSRWTQSYKKTYAEMLKYAPGVTLAKEIGGFDTASGNSIRTYLLDTDKVFKEKMKTEAALGKVKAISDLVDDNPIANLPNVADKIAWIEIWNACKRETAETHKALAPNSDAFMEQVGKRFTEVIRATQVYDSIFAKSPMLKSKNLAVQYLVSFMNEPNTTANMVESAVRSFARGETAKGIRMATSVVRAIVFTSVLKSLIYAMRDDDEDETYIEKYVGSFVNNLLNDITIFNYIPVARDVWSMAQGYDVERPDMAVISDALSSFINVVDNRGKDTSNMTEEELEAWDKKCTEANWKLADSVCAFFGIPLKNVRREINAVMDHARIAHENSGKTTWTSIEDSVKQAIADASPAFAKPDTESKSDKLYDAIINGDTAYVERLKSGYKDDKAYHNAIRKALRDNDPRIREAAIAGYNGNPSERVRISKLIIADGFEQDDVVVAINSEINEMKPDEPAGDPKKKGFYTAEDFAKEIANGDQASALIAKTDIIETAQKNGKTKEAAEKSFVSSAKSELKDLYLVGGISDSEVVDALITFCDITEDEATADVQYWTFKQDYPDVYADDAWFDKYYEEVVDSGIEIDVYMDYRNKVKDITGEGKKEKRMAVIDSMPISSTQKDALYYAEGWTESKLYEAPWH